MKPFVAITVLLTVSLTAVSAALTQQQVAAGSRGSRSQFVSSAHLGGSQFGNGQSQAVVGINSGLSSSQGSLGAGFHQGSYNPHVSFFLPGYGSWSYAPGSAGQWSFNGNGYNGGYNGVYNGGYDGGYYGGYDGGYGDGYGMGYGSGYGYGNGFPFTYGGLPGTLWRGFGGQYHWPAGSGFFSSYNPGFSGFQGQVGVGQVPVALSASRSSRSSVSSSSRSRSV